MMAQYKRMRPTASPTSPPTAPPTPSVSVPPTSVTAPDPFPKKKAVVFDVYGQQLDPDNLMPSTPNQLPSPGQRAPLSTDRAKSTIPKANTEENWTYPSEQMFYNSLKRKGKADAVHEEDMAAVVSVHNSMNERTWREVLAWESRYHPVCKNPTLARFRGRPHDMSPAARFRSLFRGYPLPFDRHDWVVDRCGDRQVRYVIDYYYRDTPDPIEIHVRPALDSPSAVFDRLRNRASLTAHYLFGPPATPVASSKTQITPLPTSTPSAPLLNPQEFDFLTNLTPQRVLDIGADVKSRCQDAHKALSEATDPPAIERANMLVNYCMGRTICPIQANSFMKALEGEGDETAAYGKMAGCLDRFYIMARRTMLEATGVAQSGPEFPSESAPPSSSSAPSSPSPAPA